MSTRHLFRRLTAALAIAVLAFSPFARAQLADLADVPLANSPSATVLPNLMYILDDSGSMNWNWMPDQIMRNSGGVTFFHCKKCAQFTVSSVDTSSSGSTAETIRSSSNHNTAAGSSVVFRAGTPPAGLALNTIYYITATNLSANRFQLSTTPGGAAINLTSSTTGATFVICSGPGGGDSGGTPGSGWPCGNDDPDPANLPGNATIPTYGDALFYAPAFNKIWYNPDIAYEPGVDSTGASLGAANPVSARADHYNNPATTNLTTSFRELVYCNTSTPTAADLANTTRCRYNGRQNVGPFLTGGAPTYFMPFHPTYGVAASASVNNNAAFPTQEFRFRVLVNNSVPHYYKIAPQEYCSDVNLTTCALANAAGTAPDATHVRPAPVRWCKTQLDAQLLTAVTGNSGTPATARCRKKFDRTAYPYARVGRMSRVDITAATGSYPKSPAAIRPDCAAAGFCTYAEELQNFANWWQYYRYRMTMMKTATGKAFLSIDDRFRVGFITINPNNPVTAAKFLAVGKFDAAQRSSFYTKLYAQTTNGGTPLREALSRVGRYYAGRTDGITSGMGADPMEYSCQANYALLTTDGYWNGADGDTIGGTSIGNEDNANSGFTTRSVGAFDGNIAGASGTLADVAAYYYKNDLRTGGGPLTPNNVPTTIKDTADHQHMVTFTLGLGLEGFMDYQQDYETAATGDFANIKAGTAGACSWTTGTCNWPAPVANEPSTLDDLWHAAVNGRGTYFSASDPNSLALGLQAALAQLHVATASASASATSSPNITQTDNFIFSSTFRTGLWDGEIQARRIDVTTGNILPAVVWSAQTNLDGRTGAASDSRNIFTISGAGGGLGKPFQFAALTSAPSGPLAAEQSFFANKCAVLAQCPLLTAAQQVIANSGDDLVNYLRGQRQHESFTPPETVAPFRTRQHVLGDPVNATPLYIQRPRLRFSDAGYTTFKDNNAGRQAVLYIGANDGMLHAFNGDTGQELWAYVPRITMPNMALLATTNWGSRHRYSVDGSPQTMDVFFGGGWKTILVAGLNAGGRGYYALDVTDPAVPKVLWEICSDPAVCTNTDPDMGYTFGNPVIAKREVDGRWVVFVTSGLNNVSPGDGRGYLYTLDVATGAVLSKVTTGFGTVAAPSGLNRMSGYADDFSFDNTAKFLYAVDLWGNVWKFTTNTATPSVTKLAQLFDGSGRPQSITTRPELASIDGFPVVYVGTGRYLGADDLVDMATLTPPQPFAYQNSIYGIKDRGVTYTNFRSGAVKENVLIDNGSTRTTSNLAVNWNLEDGWFLDLNPGNTSPGERVNIDPQLVQGTLVVAANVPNNSACAVGGDSWIYQFDYRSGRFVTTSGGAVAGWKTTGKITVGMVIVRLPSGVFRGIATRATGEQDPFTVNVVAPNYPGRRISWRELFQR